MKSGNLHFCQVADTRTLSLSNSDAKIAAVVIRRHRHRLIDPDQAGLSAASDCVTSILEMEASMLSTLFTTNADAVGMFLDFENAFPSLSRDFIHLIRLLYQDNKHTIALGNTTFPQDAINVATSVRQGCPLSADLFSICLAPFIRCCKWYLHPNVPRMKFYLDDGAMTLTITVSCPKLVKLLDLVKRTMNLHPKLAKTQITPLWDCTMASARDHFSTTCPFFL